LQHNQKELVKFLYGIRHIERCPATDTRRGRPSRWPRENLLKAAGVLRNILERETSGRVSLSSFIGQFIPILAFPSDVTEALSSGDINLQEAAQLARLTLYVFRYFTDHFHTFHSTRRFAV